MRKISTGDLFKAARLIKRGNITEIIKAAVLASRQKDMDKQSIGINAATSLLAACTEPEMEEQFYDLLGGICEKKPEEIKNQSIEATIEDFKKIIDENNILNFLKSASELSEKIPG